MGCALNQNCGGCRFRDLSLSDYQKQKKNVVLSILEQNLGSLEDIFETPIFISDGFRRRAAFAFHLQKNKLIFGFNENQSHRIVDIQNCLMLTPKINQNLENFRAFLARLCTIAVTKKLKGKKFASEQILDGDLLVTEAQNGLDVVLEADIALSYNHRTEIADFMAQNDDIIRFSYRLKHMQTAETIVQKSAPFIDIAERRVLISPGDFLQASKEGEKALIDTALRYIGNTRGKMADLFCGIGTFSYALSNLEKSKILAADISPSLLEGFQKSVHTQMIQNIEIKQKNLFLYPFEASELENFDVILFDPPRAGALEQVRKIARIEEGKKPKKIIAVSCNVGTFCRDAKVLIEAGFVLKKITFVDQFVYSDHSEVVALFEKD